MAVALGYFFAVGIGLLLGLIGGGGSILTVPILVYLFNIQPTKATSYSLFIVGVTALAGYFQQVVRKNVDYASAILFGLPSIVGVYCSRIWLLPLIPNQLITNSWFTLSKDSFLLLLFAILMLIAAVSMLYKKSQPTVSIHKRPVLLFVEGLFIGAFTGLVGAGGGFLLIPALVHWIGLDMKKAVGTSLLIITFKSLIGFMGDIQHGIDLNWNLLFLFSGCSLIGIFIGNHFNKIFPTEVLKRMFGWLVLIAGISIIFEEMAQL